MYLVLKHSFRVHRLMLNLFVITIFMSTRQWSSKLLRLITNSAMLSFLTKPLSRQNLKLRKRISSVNLKKDRYLKVLLKILHHTVYLLTLEVLTDLFTSLIFHGAELTTLRRLYNLTKRSMLLFLTLMTPRRELHLV